MIILAQDAEDVGIDQIHLNAAFQLPRQQNLRKVIFYNTIITGTKQLVLASHHRQIWRQSLQGQPDFLKSDLQEAIVGSGILRPTLNIINAQTEPDRLQSDKYTCTHTAGTNTNPYLAEDYSQAVICARIRRHHQ